MGDSHASDHVLDSLTVDGKVPEMEQMGDIIKAMLADVEREAAGEIELDKQGRKAIGKRTVGLFKARLMEAMHAAAAGMKAQKEVAAAREALCAKKCEGHLSCCPDGFMDEPCTEYVDVGEKEEPKQ